MSAPKQTFSEIYDCNLPPVFRSLLWSNLTELRQCVYKHGCDLDERLPDGRSPLEYALDHCQPVFFTELLSLGADPSCLHAKNKTNALHTTILSDKEDQAIAVVQHVVLHDLLFALYAEDVYGNTPLHIAFTMGHLSLVHALLYYNADPYRRNKAGMTPLDLWKSRFKLSEAMIVLVKNHPDFFRP